jgi:hypothetical protein
MTNLEKLENQVRGLSPEELRSFRAWFDEFDALNWDEQIKADSAGGKLDAMVSEAKAEHKSGKTRTL